MQVVSFLFSLIKKLTKLTLTKGKQFYTYAQSKIAVSISVSLFLTNSDKLSCLVHCKTHLIQTRQTIKLTETVLVVSSGLVEVNPQFTVSKSKIPDARLSVAPRLLHLSPVPACCALLSLESQSWSKPLLITVLYCIPCLQTVFCQSRRLCSVPFWFPAMFTGSQLGLVELSPFAHSEFPCGQLIGSLSSSG